MSSKGKITQSRILSLIFQNVLRSYKLIWYKPMEKDSQKEINETIPWDLFSSKLITREGGGGWVSASCSLLSLCGFNPFYPGLGMLHKGFMKWDKSWERLLNLNFKNKWCIHGSIWNHHNMYMLRCLPPSSPGPPHPTPTPYK